MGSRSIRARGDGRVRVPELIEAIRQHTVAPDHQVVGVALREAGGNPHPLTARAAALAIGDVHARQRGERGVRAGVHRIAAEKAKASDEHVEKTAGVVTNGKPATPAPVDVGKMVGIIAALGVGIGAIGTLFGGFIAGFMGLEPWWTKLVALVGAVLLVSGPSMTIAWLKLRQRTLGPVLEANGWAINGRVRVNIPLGTALTSRATLPPGSTRSLEDPYEDRAARRRRRLFSLAAIAAAAALLAAWYAQRWPFGAFPPW